MIEAIKTAHKYLKASLRPDRSQRLAEAQGFAKNEPVEVLQEHYRRTALTIIRLTQSLKRKGVAI